MMRCIIKYNDRVIFDIHRHARTLNLYTPSGISRSPQVLTWYVQGDVSTTSPSSFLRRQVGDLPFIVWASLSGLPKKSPGRPTARHTNCTGPVIQDIDSNPRTDLQVVSSDDWFLHPLHRSCNQTTTPTLRLSPLELSRRVNLDYFDDLLWKTPTPSIFGHTCLHMWCNVPFDWV